MLAELRGIWHREQCVRACVTGFPPRLRQALAEQGSGDRRQVRCRRNCQAHDDRTAAAILIKQAGNQASHPPTKRRQQQRRHSAADPFDPSMLHDPPPSTLRRTSARCKSRKMSRAQSAPSDRNCLHSMSPSRAQIWTDDADGGQLGGVWGILNLPQLPKAEGSWCH